MTRVAIYARYSTDLQSIHSVEDQIRLCREYANRQGWVITHTFSDSAISGANLLRPGIQKTLEGIRERAFDVLLSESLDRLSRSQEDAPHIFNRAQHSDIEIVTLEEGVITELHIGLKGTMSALQLKQIAEKTRRGLSGVAKRGQSAGGTAYGYEPIRQMGDNGKPIRGNRRIVESEAAVVNRIFRDYVIGKSPKRIAADLNKEGIKAPTGGDWGQSTINGNRKRGNGILNNELYVGKQVWNRQRFVKNPDTGRREARPNPESEWIITDVPELRIVPQELRDQVRAQQQMLEHAGPAMWTSRRPKGLLSGLLKCGCCGGGFAKMAARHSGCSTARNKGTCDNMLTIRVDLLEEQVIGALRSRLMNEELSRKFCEEYARHMEKLRREHNSSLSGYRAEYERNKREVQKVIEAIADGVSPSLIRDRANQLADRQVVLESLLAETHDIPVLLHPKMSERYHEEVRNLLTSLNEPEHREESAIIVRNLIDRIVLTPADDRQGLTIDLHGDLAGILQIASGNGLTAIPQKRIPTKAKGASVGDAHQVKLVAGAGFEPATFRL
jgi:site-specific DNA recombinase